MSTFLSKRALAAPVLALSLALSAPASVGAQERTEGWFDCFQASAPDDLSDILVLDLLAHEGFGKAPQPSFRGRFAAIVVHCAMQNDVPEENLSQVSEYALRSLGKQGIRSHLIALGVSPDFLDRTVEAVRRQEAGEDAGEKLRSSLHAETERVGLPPEISAQLPILLVFYADSMLAMEKAPPSN